MVRLIPPCAIALALLLSAGSAHTAELKPSKAEVTFHISHPAKEYDAHLMPGGATVTGRFDPADLSKTGADISIKVGSFNSDNTRRDSHMMEVLEGLIFPTIDWKFDGLAGIKGTLSPGSYSAVASGPIILHGVTRPLDVPITLDIDGKGTVTVKATLSVSLESFEIERPTLLFVPIEDSVPIQVKMVFDGGKDLLYLPAAAAPPEPTAGSEAGAAGSEGENVKETAP